MVAARGWGDIADMSEHQTSSNAFADLSDAIERRVVAAAPLVAGLIWNGRGQLSATLWRAGVLVTSEQGLPNRADFTAILPGNRRVAATLAGRDPSTNVAALRIEADAVPFERAEPTAPGALILALGSDGAGGVTARMSGIEVRGPAWESQRGGKIDHLVRIGARIGPGAEGGPVLDARGAVLGMSTFGPRRTVLVIPSATIDRALTPLLEQGRVARGWLGVGLQQVVLPADIATRAGAPHGLMVMSFADTAPAAGKLLPGDILIAIDGSPVAELRDVAGKLGPDTVGRDLSLSVVRAGAVTTVSVTITARPE